MRNDLKKIEAKIDELETRLDPPIIKFRLILVGDGEILDCDLETGEKWPVDQETFDETIKKSPIILKNWEYAGINCDDIRARLGIYD